MNARPALLTLLPLLLLLLACAPEGPGEEQAPFAADPTVADDQTPEDKTPTPHAVSDGTERWLRAGEVDSEALDAWLRSYAWRRWASSTGIRPTPQGGSRVFANTVLADSLQRGDATHPLGAIGVRELYEDDLITPRAINLTVKLTEDDGDGAGWLWVERVALDRGGVISVEEPAAPGCVACHAPAAVDMVQSRWPLGR